MLHLTAPRGAIVTARAAGERQYARREERRVSTDPSPRAGSMVLGDRVDGVSRCVHGLPRPCVFCSRSYWPMMLLWAGMLVLLWFALGPSHPVRRADGGSLDLAPRARGGRTGDAPSASPVVPRPRGRARPPPYAGRWNIRLAARALRMESPSRRTHAGIRWQQGRLTLPGRVGARRCQCPRNLLCHPHAIGRRRTVHRAPRGAHCGCYCQVWFLISIRCCYSAPSCFGSSLCWISPPPEIRT